jgi:hypothetical protein
MIQGRSAEDEATAYHEAGHAVMGALRDLLPFSVSIVPARNGIVGRTDFPDAPPAFKNYLGTSPEKQAYIENLVMIEVAAAIAHDILNPSRVHDAGDAHDLQRARTIIEQNASWAENDRETYLQSLRNFARPMIAANWAWVQAVALALLEQRELTGADVMKCRPA